MKGHPIPLAITENAQKVAIWHKHLEKAEPSFIEPTATIAKSCVVNIKEF